MNFKTSVLLSLLASTAEAHFRIPYPGERNSTNWDTQTTSPCGGDNAVVLPRYEWNPEGSPVEINYHHAYGVGAIYFCGNGNCTTGADFDELLYEPVDQTKGNFCIPALQLPSKYNTVNTTGVVQIIYGAPGDEAGDYDFMYNCIDIIVSKDGPIFDGTQCSNSSSTIVYDEQLEELEEDNDDAQVDSFSSISYLEKIRISTQSANSASSKASASAASTSDDMAGMDMGTTTTTSDDMAGMDMGSTTAASSAAASTTDAMAGMDMGSSTAASSKAAASAASSSAVASSAASSSSSAGANANVASFGVFFLSLLSLFL